MKNSKTTLLVLALAAMVLTAGAGDNADSDGSRSDREDKTTVVPTQPATEVERPDQASQSRPNENRAPVSEERGSQSTGNGSDGARSPRTERDAAQAPESRPQVNQTPDRYEQQDRRYTEPARIQTRWSDGTSGAGTEVNVLRSGGEPNRGRGGGGYRGGHGPGPFDRRPTYYHGGRHRHGPHDHWRYRHYYDSWRFLFYLGPVIYYPPIHYPHVIRVPRARVGVYVRYTGDDAVGSAFANSVREQLRDQGLRVVYSQDNARLELYIISMERDPDDPGYNSAISVSYVWYPGHRFITAQMVDAGINEVDDLAASVAAYADDLVDEYR